MKLRSLKLRKSEAGDQTKMAGRKRRRLKYISVLPSLITLMNGACGFIAIAFASRSPVLGYSLPFLRRSAETSLSIAGYLILVAMIADLLDGRVARMTRTTSSFGGQLDSLSDAISFGVAPAFLMLKVMDIHLDYLKIENLSLSMLVGRLIFFSAILYVICAIVRLARFNVENDEDAAAHMNFSGIPTPAAAGVITSMVIFHQQLLNMLIGQNSGFFRTFEIISLSVFPVTCLLMGILMVSRICYPHLANQLIRSKKTLHGLLIFFAAVILAIWNIQLALVAAFCGFALYGILRWLFGKMFGKLSSKRQIKNQAASE